MTAEPKEFDNRVYIVNKPSGPTSFDVVEAFRKATGTRKVGHTGTLDPLAEGVLLLCTGRATRAVEHFMNLPKVYEFTVRLGVETTTLDAEGEVVREAPCPPIAEERLREVADGFVGTYELSPPAYSALKHNGKRLYALARAGETPAVARRKVTIYEMDMLRAEPPDVRLCIRCSRGTYVRSLAKDYGDRLGLPAHIRSLVRTAIGPFTVERAIPGAAIFDANIEAIRGVELRQALDFMPGIVLTEASTRGLLDGALPAGNDVVETIGPVSNSDALRILDQDGVLLAIGKRHKTNTRMWVDSYRLVVDQRRM